MQWSPSGQVMEQLYDGVWGQWVADTRVLLERLPAALPALPVPEQVALTFERWLILLKARPARGLTAPPPPHPHAAVLLTRRHSCAAPWARRTSVPDAARPCP